MRPPEASGCCSQNSRKPRGAWGGIAVAPSGVHGARAKRGPEQGVPCARERVPCGRTCVGAVRACRTCFLLRWASGPGAAQGRAGRRQGSGGSAGLRVDGSLRDLQVSAAGGPDKEQVPRHQKLDL